jgi:hypothetical protein
MKKILSSFYFILFFSCLSFSQAVGIGTTTPHPKAVLEIKATDKGVLFPRLTTAQRDAIASPPNGLHVFNTDDHCLNYYDSTNQLWNCYCFNCETIIINITANACKVDFYYSYARNNPSTKYIINIAAGVTISGCSSGDTALSFSSMPFDAVMTINNRGTIAGAGGRGGNGAKITSNFNCINQADSAHSGQAGGSAISTKAGVLVTVNNYSIISGAGGGGGGGGIFSSSAPGGGGGGGAGSIGGTGGNAGGIMATPINSGVCTYYDQGTTNGQTGTITIGGTGGNGGSFANPGGAGGNRAQPGSGANITVGGAAGKAIAGGGGNSIINIGGQFFGAVD